MELLQVNLQPGFGGGEIYTCFLGKALRRLGQRFSLIVHRKANWWHEHDTGASHIYSVDAYEDILELPFHRPAWLIYHTPDGGNRLLRLKAQGCRIAAFVHMPLYQRRDEHFRAYDCLFAVSGYVLSGLLDRGLTKTHLQPLYGVASLDRADSSNHITANSIYSWDKRKMRDRLLSWIYPAWYFLQPRQAFQRRAGLTLGVVSRITPIKQFPSLFASIAPALAERRVNLEIFGSGGYASIRDTRRELKIMGNLVRWWGEQRNVQRVYPQFDYLLTGLPEKEALGLNVIEAQMCGTPILAPKAPPFNETVLDGRSGYLYADPRTDGAHGFVQLIEELISGRLKRPNPLEATDHLARFSEKAFDERVRGMLEALAAA